MGFPGGAVLLDRSGRPRPLAGNPAPGGHGSGRDQSQWRWQLSRGHSRLFTQLCAFSTSKHSKQAH